MKKILLNILLLLLVSDTLFAQGINFNETLSWKAVLEKARLEHKYIFVDIGATWCIPCHMMERDVFTQKAVGDYYNNNFIAVKVQADKTDKDNTFIKSWYVDAQEILKAYNVGAFPTYLYLSPEGTLTQQGAGVMSVADFLSAGRKAFDPKENMAARKASFYDHQMPMAEEGAFAIKLQHAGNYKEAQLVAKDYKEKYLDKADDQVLMTKDNLNFILNFTGLMSLNDRYFQLFYNQGDKIDKLIADPGMSYRLVNGFIAGSIVKPALYDQKGGAISNTPDWTAIRDKVKNRYPDRANDVVLYEKYIFYSKISDWPKASKSGIELVERGDLNKSNSRAFTMNQVAYSTLFLHSNDHQELKLAARWLKELLKSKPDDYATLDTYSCLLYKLGKKDEAIDYEKKAIEALRRSKESDPEYYLKIFNDNIDNMNQGKPTW